MLRYKIDRARPGLVALYDIRPVNGAGPFLQPRSPHGANLNREVTDLWRQRHLGADCTRTIFSESAIYHQHHHHQICIVPITIKTGRWHTTNINEVIK